MTQTGRLVYNGMHERLVLIRGVGSPDLKIAHLFGFDVHKRGGKGARQNEHFRRGGNVQNFLKGALRAVGALILLAGGDGAKAP